MVPLAPRGACYQVVPAREGWAMGEKLKAGEGPLSLAQEVVRLIRAGRTCPLAARRAGPQPRSGNPRVRHHSR